MRTEELLSLLREEIDSCGPEIDEVLVAWLGDAAGSLEHARELSAHLQRMSHACEVIGLGGISNLLGWIGETGQMLAEQVHVARDPGEVALGAWLIWLTGWHQALSRFFECNTEDDAISAVVDFVSRSPVSLRLTDLRHLADALRSGPSLPAEMLEEATPDDSEMEDEASLDLPDDIDVGLLEMFLQESPTQLEFLAAVVQAQIDGHASSADLDEAQRIAHTFKGSGNIIGIRGVGRLAHHIEDVLALAATAPAKPTASMWRDVLQAVACLDQMVYALKGDEQAPGDVRRWMLRMHEWSCALRSSDPASGDAAIRVENSARGRSAVAEPQESTSAEGGEPSKARLPSVPSGNGPPGESNRPPASDAEPGAVLRAEVGAVERLVRRAGQAMVQHGRMNEHLRVIELQLKQLMASNERLLKHLRNLEIAVDRQAVSLREKADEADALLDPLEMDRYNELHALTRFAAEMGADELDHARGACQEINHASAILRKHGIDLREQHREMNALRLVPVRNVVARLRRNVSQAAAATRKQARLVVDDNQVKLDSVMLERLTEPLLHLLRNAVDHGIEAPADRELLGKPVSGEVRVAFQRIGGHVRVEVQDDGAGLDRGAIHARAAALGLLDDQVEATADDLSRLILLPGFSTRSEVTEISGRGVGLDVVAQRVRAMKGTLAIQTQPLMGTTFVLTIPSGSGIEHALVVEVAQVQYALPSASVALALAAVDGGVDGREFVHGQQRLKRVWLGTWLGLPEPQDLDVVRRPHVLAHVDGEEVALAVDRIVDSRELILQDIGGFLRRVPGLGGGVLRPDGRVIFTLDLESLAATGTSQRRREGQLAFPQNESPPRKHVLVVDDAISVRKSLQQLVQDAGFDVSVARDGQDAWEMLSRRHTDIVLTDLEMPTLNGLELAKRVRGSSELANMPIMMITSRSSDKHRRLAAEAGVDVFLTKPHSDERLLTEMRRLLS